MNYFYCNLVKNGAKIKRFFGSAKSFEEKTWKGLKKAGLFGQNATSRCLNP